MPRRISGTAIIIVPYVRASGMVSFTIPWQDRRRGCRSYFLGERLPVTSSGTSTNTTNITFNGILLGFSILASSYSDGDTFTFQPTGFNPNLETIYMKAAESYEFERPVTLVSGDSLTFTYNNNEGSNKTIYYDIEFARDDL